MTNEQLSFDWTRTGRTGYYGYVIHVPANTNSNVDACMALSTKLDKIINIEIQEREKLKVERNASKQLEKEKQKAATKLHK